MNTTPKSHIAGPGCDHGYPQHLCPLCSAIGGSFAEAHAPALEYGDREALHAGAQALSMMAHDMEKAGDTKTAPLRHYAATLRKLAAAKQP